MIMNAPFRIGKAGMASAAGLAGIADEQADEQADLGFSPTLPPPMAVEEPHLLQVEVVLAAPHGVTRNLLPPGLKGLRASMMEVGSMACLSSWSIGETDPLGPLAEDAAGASFPTAMATIVHLNGTPSEQTLTRQLDPQCWAFAWRVDEHRVAVAEARYRLPSTVRTEKDIAVVRQLCTAGIEGAPLRRLEAMNDRAQIAAPNTSSALPKPPGAVRSRFVRWTAALTQRLRWSTLGALALGGAVCMVAALQIKSTREGEAQRFRQLTDATMAQQLARVMAAGDYGEVQGDLEAFAGLGYFKGAVVIDARSRAVASAGTVPTMRIGQALTGTERADVRVVPLKTAVSNSDAQLLIWASEAPLPGVSALGELGLFAAGVLLILTTLAGSALLWRQRQIESGKWLSSRS